MPGWGGGVRGDRCGRTARPGKGECGDRHRMEPGRRRISPGGGARILARASGRATVPGRDRARGGPARSRPRRTSRRRAAAATAQVYGSPTTYGAPEGYGTYGPPAPRNPARVRPAVAPAPSSPGAAADGRLVAALAAAPGAATEPGRAGAGRPAPQPRRAPGDRVRQPQGRRAQDHRHGARRGHASAAPAAAACWPGTTTSCAARWACGPAAPGTRRRSGTWSRSWPRSSCTPAPALTERLDDFLRHASDGSYDVLAGEEDPRFSWRLDPPTVRRVLDLLTRTHEVICVDTGNNVESGNWRTIMEAADQLVITTVPREDSAFSADWMMDVLIEAGREELVANAVTLVSMTTPRPSPMQDDLVRHFRHAHPRGLRGAVRPGAGAGRLDRPHRAPAGHPRGLARGRRGDHGAVRSVTHVRVPSAIGRVDSPLVDRARHLARVTRVLRRLPGA